MATVTKTPQQNKPAATVKTEKKAVAKPQSNQVFLFDKGNYMGMIGGVLLILIGFALMSGGKSADPHQFNYDEIYSFRRITLAPIVILLGFVIEVYAIMKKPAETVQA